MADFQVTCTNKSTAHGIVDLGNHIGGQWVRAAQSIIQFIRDGHTFFVNAGGFRTDVRIQNPGPYEYVQTTPDRTSKNNLDNLPPCPPGLKRN